MAVSAGQPGHSSALDEPVQSHRRWSPPRVHGTGVGEAAEIRGLVLDTRAEMQRTVRVELRDGKSGRVVATCESNEAGAFQLAGVAPGTWLLVAVDSRGQALAQREVLLPSRASIRGVELVTGAMCTIAPEVTGLLHLRGQHVQARVTNSRGTLFARDMFGPPYAGTLLVPIGGLYRLEVESSDGLFRGSSPLIANSARRLAVDVGLQGPWMRVRLEVADVGDADLGEIGVTIFAGGEELEQVCPFEGDACWVWLPARAHGARVTILARVGGEWFGRLQRERFDGGPLVVPLVRVMQKRVRVLGASGEPVPGLEVRSTSGAQVTTDEGGVVELRAAEGETLQLMSGEVQLGAVVMRERDAEAALVMQMYSRLEGRISAAERLGQRDWAVHLSAAGFDRPHVVDGRSDGSWVACLPVPIGTPVRVQAWSGGSPVSEVATANGEGRIIDLPILTRQLLVQPVLADVVRVAGTVRFRWRDANGWAEKLVGVSPNDPVASMFPMIADEYVVGFQPSDEPWHAREFVLGPEEEEGGHLLDWR
jgi:hypothetical protein